MRGAGNAIERVKNWLSGRVAVSGLKTLTGTGAKVFLYIVCRNKVLATSRNVPG